MDRWDPWAGILNGPVDGPAKVRAVYPVVIGARGMAIVHRGSGFRGVIGGFERDGVMIRGTSGLDRLFPLRPGAFEVDGAAVTLAPPRTVKAPASATATTASGSVAVERAPARVAQASRILVEGVHDAELVEKVWGDDLRVEGVVVERLDGVDHLAETIAAYSPGPSRRLGVLVDHLVPGSKEARLAEEVAHPHVLVTGTPFVDIWQAVKPEVVGIAAWPQVPRGVDWKSGVCRQLAVDDPGAMWRRILASIRSYADLAPALVGAVERLIDFVTEPGER